MNTANSKLYVLFLSQLVALMIATWLIYEENLIVRLLMLAFAVGCVTVIDLLAIRKWCRMKRGVK